MQAKHLLKPVAILFGLLSLAGCTSEGADLPPLPAAAPLAQAYVLGPGDKLRIVVFNLNALNSVTTPAGTSASGNASSAQDPNALTISDTGLVAAPVIGEIKAGGLTVEQLEKKITTDLAKYINDPNVGVEVLTYRPFFILGEVKTPGNYPYVANLNVRAAVATAGGYTYRANKDLVIVERKDEGHVIRGRATPTTPILPDDVITIPERFF